MEVIRQWAFGVCCAAVAAGLVQMLLPDSSLGKLGRTVTAAFFICSLAFPLFQAVPTHTAELEPFPVEESQEVSRNLELLLDQRLQEQVQEALRTLTQEKLEEMGIEGGDVRIDISTQQGAPLDQEDLAVEIALPEEYRFRHDELVQSLEYQLGIQVRLEYKDG